MINCTHTKIYSFEFEANDAITPTFKLESTGLMGGDAGFGGYAEVSIEDHWVIVELVDLSGKVHTHKCRSIKLRTEGDAEIRTLADGLHKIGRALKAIIRRA